MSSENYRWIPKDSDTCSRVDTCQTCLVITFIGYKPVLDEVSVKYQLNSKQFRY